MSQAAHNLLHSQIAGRAKGHSHQDFPFQMELPGFLRIRWNWFVENFHRSCAGLLFRTGFRRRSSGGHRAETCGRHRASLLAATLCNTCRCATEAGAGNCSRDAMRATSSIAVAWSGGQIKCPQAGDGQHAFLFRRALNAVRISETTGLNFAKWPLQCRLGGTAGRKGLGHDFLFGPYRCHNLIRWVESANHYCLFRLHFRHNRLRQLGHLD